MAKPIKRARSAGTGNFDYNSFISDFAAPDDPPNTLQGGIGARSSGGYGGVTAFYVGGDLRMQAIKGSSYSGSAFDSLTAFSGEIYNISASTEGLAAAYFASVWAYRCVMARSQAVARMPYKIVHKKTRREIDEHPLLYALDEAPDFLRRLEWALNIWGEAFGVKYRNQFNYPAALRWLNPLSVLVDTTEGAIREFSYSPLNGGDHEVFQPEDVIYMHTDNPFDDLRGMSPFLSILDEIGIDRDLSRMTRAFYANDARPGMLLVPRNNVTLSQADADQFMETWKANFGSPRNAGRPALMPFDIEVREVQRPPNSDDVALRESIRREICAAFGVPLSYAGAWDDATYQSAPEQRRSFYEDTVVPRCDWIADALNRQAMPFFDPDGDAAFEFDFSEILALGDAQSAQISLYIQGLQAGVVTMNEVRGKLNLEPLPTGDVLFVGGAMVRVEDVGKPAQNTESGAGDGGMNFMGGAQQPPSNTPSAPTQPPSNTPSAPVQDWSSGNSAPSESFRPASTAVVRSPAGIPPVIPVTSLEEKRRQQETPPRIARGDEPEAKAEESPVAHQRKLPLPESRPLAPRSTIPVARPKIPLAGDPPNLSAEAVYTSNVPLAGVDGETEKVREALDNRFAESLDAVTPGVTMRASDANIPAVPPAAGGAQRRMIYVEDEQKRTSGPQIPPTPRVPPRPQPPQPTPMPSPNAVSGAITILPAQETPRNIAEIDAQTIEQKPRAEHLILNDGDESAALRESNPSIPHMATFADEAATGDQAKLDYLSIDEAMNASEADSQSDRLPLVSSMAEAKHDMEAWERRATNKGARNAARNFKTDEIPVALQEQIRNELLAAPSDKTEQRGAVREIFARARDELAKYKEGNAATPEEYDAYWRDYETTMREIGEAWVNDYNDQVLETLLKRLNDKSRPEDIEEIMAHFEGELEKAWLGTDDAPGPMARLVLAGMSSAQTSLVTGKVPTPTVEVEQPQIQPTIKAMIESDAMIAPDEAEREAVQPATKAVEMRVDWSLVDEDARRAAKLIVGRAIRNVNSTTLAAVRKAMVEWIESGESLDALRRTLAGIFKDRLRAARIAQTESTNAYSHGARARYEKSGIKRIRFHTARDARVCPVCAPLHNTIAIMGVGWTGIKGNPFPPIHVGCRCFISPVVDE